MFSPCEVRQMPAQPVLSIRSRTPMDNLQQVLGQSYEKIALLLNELGENPAGCPFVIYYNMDMQDLDVEVGFPVSSALPGKGAIQAGDFPAGWAATCEYTGPYPEMVSAYEALTHWIQEHNYQPTGVAIEVYLNSPSQTPPEELKTQIFLPVQEN